MYIKICILMFCCINFGDSIYNPIDISTKPPYTKKEWRTIALDPENMNNIQMHHNYSRVFIHSSNTEAREPKAQPIFDQIPEGSQTIEQISGFDQKPSNWGHIQTEEQNTGDIEQIVVHDKLLGFEINDKLDFNQHPSEEQIVQTRPGKFQHQNNGPPNQNYQAPIGISNNPPNTRESINIQVPQRSYEIYPFTEIKPFSNMAFENCPKNATGQLVYLWSCSQYLNCWKGRKHIQNCPPGTLFNPETLECDYSHKVNCISGPHNQKVKFEKYISHPNPGNAARNQQIATPQKMCPSGFSGLVPHPTDCTKFINCANGQTFVQDCGPGTAFNSRIQACDWPYKVDCEINKFETSTTSYILNEQDVRSMPHQRQNYQTQNSQSGLQTNCNSGQNCPYPQSNHQQSAPNYNQIGLKGSQTSRSCNNCAKSGTNNHQGTTGLRYDINPNQPGCNIQRTLQTGFVVTDQNIFNPQIGNCGGMNQPQCRDNLGQNSRGIDGQSQVSNQRDPSQNCDTNCRPQNLGTTQEYPRQDCTGTHCRPFIGQNSGTIHSQVLNQGYPRPQCIGGNCSPNIGHNSGSTTGHLQVLNQGYAGQECTGNNCRPNIGQNSGGTPGHSQVLNQGYPGQECTGNNCRPNIGHNSGGTGGHSQVLNQGYPGQECTGNNCRPNIGQNSGSTIGHSQVLNQAYPDQECTGNNCRPNIGQNSGGTPGHSHVLNEGFPGQECTGNNCRPNIGQNSGGSIGGYPIPVCSGTNCQQTPSGSGQSQSFVPGYSNMNCPVSNPNCQNPTNQQEQPPNKYQRIFNVTTQTWQYIPQNIGQQSSSSNQQYWISRPIHHSSQGTHQFEGSNQGSGQHSHLGYEQTEQPKTEAKCPTGHNGLLPHPFICEKFLNCANGRTFVQNCGPGTVFNPKLKVCDWPYNVDCTTSTADNFRGINIGATTGRPSTWSQHSNTGSYQPPSNAPNNGYQPRGTHNPNTNFYQTTSQPASSYQPRGNYNPSGSPDQQYGSSNTQNYYIQSQTHRNTTGRNYIGVIGHRRPNSNDPTAQTFQDCHGTSCVPFATPNSGGSYSTIGHTNHHQTGSTNQYSSSGFVPQPNGIPSNQDKHQPQGAPNCFGSQCVNSKLDFGSGTSHGGPSPNSNLQEGNINQKNESRVYYITPEPTNQQNYRPIYEQRQTTTPKYVYRKEGSSKPYPTPKIYLVPPPLPVPELETPFGKEENKNKHGPAPFPSTDVNADYDFDTEEVTELPKLGSSQQKPKQIWKSGSKCQENEFMCKINECIPINWLCDGNQDCSNGFDEKNCGSYITHFTKIPNSRLYKHEIEKWLNTDLETCANYCLNSKSFQCRSFNFRNEDNTCLMCDTNVGSSGALSMSHLYDYYEISKFSVNCTGMYECSNKKCINFTQVCDGNDDCGNRQDEKNCKASAIGYEIKLAGSQGSNEGRIEVKVFGEWGYICDDRFGLRNADVACKELGFPQGAVEVKPSSHFAKNIKDNETYYLMDDVQCLGNETSIRNCDFSGWGVHNCMPQEIVGVICKTEQEICPGEHWKCDTTNECLPLQFLCDGVFDCGDHSDEGVQHCEAPVELRLANGANKLEGRVEVRYHGVWGTICDDDFNDNTAKVVCQSLGYRGSAVAKKDGAFGAGVGPIWLDQVNCFGNESFIDDCSHWNWGEHNCEHAEDAGVVCSNLDTSEYEKRSKTKGSPHVLPLLEKNSIDDIFKGKCGHTGEDLFFEEEDQDSDVQFRVVKGSVAKRGQYPWQATIRVKGKSIKSSHWCGAVVISNKFVLTAAHCLVGFSKGSYVVRAGDYNIDEEEGSEVEAFIEDFFVHERFRQDGHMNNDIALIKLKGPGLRLSKQVQPICLPEKNAAYKPGLNCTISGFGSTETGKSSSSHVLRAGWVKIQADNVCSMEQVYGDSITKGMFCAGSLDEGVDSCDGDSGGPLACLDKGLYTLYGLTSWGQRCGHANKPGVYVKISHYRSWIDKKIEANT